MNPPPDFDRLARLYRWMELFSFGPWLMRCRCAFLQEMLASRRALLLGDGDGRFTARLLAANPHVQIDAVDASQAMLDSLLRRCSPHGGRVRAHRADARLWGPVDGDVGPGYDLVVAHFFLDCLTTDEVRSLALRLRRIVAPSAQWAVSEFALPEGRYGRAIARASVTALYWAFAALTGLQVRALPDHRAALAASGFTPIARRTGLRGLLASELWAANSCLPDTGESGDAALATSGSAGRLRVAAADVL